MDQIFDALREALKDRYRVDGEIGRGGMATVYAAEDLRHGRRVAIKVLSPDLATSVGAEGVLDVAGPDVFAGVSDDMTSFAEAVTRVMQDADWARAIGENARSWALSRFDFEASTRRLGQSYREFIAAARARAGAGN